MKLILSQIFIETSYIVCWNYCEDLQYEINHFILK
jgi:hypothetical protein